jgi:hypothetical protein
MIQGLNVAIDPGEADPDMGLIPGPSTVMADGLPGMMALFVCKAKSISRVSINDSNRHARRTVLDAQDIH